MHVKTKKSLLLVDDNPDDLLHLQRSIKGCGARIEVARDGLQALDKLQTQSFDLVVSDISMPVLDGIGLAGRLKQAQPRQRTPILFVSGVADDSDRASAIRAGGASVISKPVDPELLVAHVEAVEAEAAEKQALFDELTEIKQLSETDGLTGVLNRRGMEAAFNAELISAAALNVSVSLILIDVDRFKRFNDLYGHVGGDRVLKRVAAVLSNCCRRGTDMVGRFGGEEFAVMCMGLGPLEAEAFSQYLVQSVANLGIRHDGSSVGNLTISAGLITAIATPHNAPDLSSLFAKADTALYEA